MLKIARRLLLLAMAAPLALSAPAARAEVKEVSIARQFGLQYLPLIIMEKHKLVEKQAAAAKVDLKASWKQFSGGASVNEALISGALDVVAGGTGPLVMIWDKTRSNIGVKGLAAVSEMPMVLLSRNPEVKSLADLSARDRIALPAVKTSMQAITLQMAAAQMFGIENYRKFDTLTVSMPHPDAVAAMLSGKLEVNAHFTSAPYSYTELQDPQIRKVTSSFDVYGGPASLIVIYGTTKFYEQNPVTVKIVIDALKAACDMIRADRRQALADYAELTRETLDPKLVEQFIADKEIDFVITPKGMGQVAEFMYKVGIIKNQPTRWQDLFFPPIHAGQGS